MPVSAGLRGCREKWRPNGTTAPVKKDDPACSTSICMTMTLHQSCLGGHGWEADTVGRSGSGHGWEADTVGRRTRSDGREADTVGRRKAARALRTGFTVGSFAACDRLVTGRLRPGETVYVCRARSRVRGRRQYDYVWL